jgi:hypothetical protein
MRTVTSKTRYKMSVDMTRIRGGDGRSKSGPRSCESWGQWARAGCRTPAQNASSLPNLPAPHPGAAALPKAYIGGLSGTRHLMVHGIAPSVRPGSLCRRVVKLQLWIVRCGRLGSTLAFHPLRVMGALSVMGGVMRGTLPSIGARASVTAKKASQRALRGTL